MEKMSINFLVLLLKWLFDWIRFHSRKIMGTLVWSRSYDFKTVSKKPSKAKMCHKNCQKPKSHKNLLQNSPNSDKNASKYKNVCKMCQSTFQKSKKKTEICLLANFCHMFSHVYFWSHSGPKCTLLIIWEMLL